VLVPYLKRRVGTIFEGQEICYYLKKNGKNGLLLPSLRVMRHRAKLGKVNVVAEHVYEDYSGEMSGAQKDKRDEGPEQIRVPGNMSHMSA
jgi:hypothetical protein